MLAADAAFDAVQAGRRNDQLTAYPELFKTSWLHTELYRARNFKQWMSKGLYLGTLMVGIEQKLMGGNWAGYLFSHPLDNDNTDGTFHLSNSVKFTSNTYGGFSGTAMYGFSNQAGAFAQNRAWSVGAKYAYSTFNIGAVYENVSGAGSSTTGSIASDDYFGFAASNQKIYGVGASYGIGDALIGAVYTHVKVEAPTASVYVGDLPLGSGGLKFDNFEVNAKYNFAPDFFVGGMYTYTRAIVSNGGVDSSLHWNQAGLMAEYFLSKRTGVYAQLVYQKVSGGDWHGAGYSPHPRSSGIVVEFPSGGGPCSFDPLLLNATGAPSRREVQAAQRSSSIWLATRESPMTLLNLERCDMTTMRRQLASIVTLLAVLQLPFVTVHNVPQFESEIDVILLTA